MPAAQLRPYGSWRSPQSAAQAVAAGVGLGEVAFDGDTLLWLEQRPSESGRGVVVRRTADGHCQDQFAAPFSARSRVHEYGGGAWLAHGGVLFFCNDADQRVHRLDPGATPLPITPEAKLRYADFCFDARRGLLWCVREDHRAAGEARSTLVALRADGDAEGGRVAVDGSDFVAAPRLSPDGRQLAWLRWNHPDMPFFACELWLAQVDDAGALHDARCIAGGADEAAQQPMWTAAGELLFVSDRSGWWNLYRWHDAQAQPLCPMAAEFGTPPWVFGLAGHAFVGERRLACSFTQQGVSKLGLLDLDTLHFEPLPTPFTQIVHLAGGAGRLALCAASPLAPSSIHQLQLSDNSLSVLRAGSSLAVDAAFTSVAEALQFPTADGQLAHGFFYAPRNADFVAPSGEKPPLLVLSHGGPTAMSGNDYKAGIQYWTSRGFAVLDVNYRGSTGFGRAYRCALDAQWGIADVEDCVRGASFLVQRGDVDGARLAIRGGSAGGYTTLCALAFHDRFRCGCSRYGIGDLETLATDTHKFEARYLDRMVGPWPAARDLYRARSPIHHLEGFNCPLILFQGSEDRAVPPEQSRRMHAAVRAKGLPVAYIEFPGEQHGFRQAANIVRALEAEAYFYARVFGFTLADAVEPVVIDNLPG